MSTVALLVPHGKRSLRVELPPAVARWLCDQLGEALGEPRPKPRRLVRLRRGRWIPTNGRTAR
jgi:hypothetical protein